MIFTVRQSFIKFIRTSGAKNFVLISGTVHMLQQCKYAGDNLTSPPPVA